MVETINREVGEISSAIDVLSAMITPAILILASGSLLATTSGRLIRVTDRVRELASHLEALARTAEPLDEFGRDRRPLLYRLLVAASRRARILQRAMTRLYLSIAAFIVTSVAIGVISLTEFDGGWVALLLGFIGAALLFSASVHLIVESRIALKSTYAETAFIRKWGERHLGEPEEIKAGE